MKSLLQKVIVNLIAIFVASQLISGIRWGDDLKTLILAAIVLSLANAFLRPILKLYFLPINVITLGLFGWLINVLIIYLTTLLVPGFEIVPFSLNVLGTNFVLNQFLAYVFVSFFLNLITTVTSWLII